jgi:hypothetical protein
MSSSGSTQNIYGIASGSSTYTNVSNPSQLTNNPIVSSSVTSSGGSGTISFNNSLVGSTYCQSLMCPDLDKVFSDFEEFVRFVQQTVQKSYPITAIISEFVAAMSARTTVRPVLFVRLVWRERNPGVYFDINYTLHRLQIKGIYLEYGADHRGDPLFKDALGLTLV